MPLGTGDPASETGEDSLSVISFDSDFETKTKRKSFHKPPPTSPKSPYHSKPRKVASWKSLKTAASMPLGNRVSLTPQKLWLGSPKQGHVPGTPVYREKEDMYDEIIELKKLLHVQKSDVDQMRTKLRRLEEENSRKGRQIEQLLDPSRGPDFVRTLAEKRPDTGWVVNGLKQRVLKLEQQCKDKDSTIHKLQTDMKTTNLEEMRIAMETYYEEIHRLQTLLASSEATGRKPPTEKKSGLKRQKKMSSALLSLSRSVQELTEENRTLKEDLDRVLSNSPTVSRTKGYTEWSKPRLLRRIAELENKLSSMESSKPSSQVDRSDPPDHSASSPAAHRQPPSECQEENERLRGAVRSLKDERKALQAQLQEREVEVRQLLRAQAGLQKELEGVKEGEKETRGREEALREEVHALTKKLQERREINKEEGGGPPDMTPELQEQPRPDHPASSPSQQASEGEDAHATCTCSEGRRQAAARLLQAWWKAYRHQRTTAVLDEAATVLQAAFRGHHARMKLLSSKACGSASPGVPSLPSQGTAVQAEGDPGQEEAITVIQSILRAHLARIRHRSTLQRPSSAAPAKRPAPAARSEPSSPPLPAASGMEDSEVSSGDTVEGLAPEDEDEAARGPGAPAAPWPCPAASPSSGPQPVVPPCAEDVNSDDSDEIVIAPSLPVKRNALPP